MNAVEILAVLKVAVYIAPLALLLRDLEWRWLTAAIITLVVANVMVALGADRLTVQYVGLLFQAFLIVHVVDLSRWRRQRT